MLCCSSAKRRSISRLATAASADISELAAEEEHAGNLDGASEAAAAVSVNLDISHLEVYRLS